MTSRLPTYVTMSAVDASTALAGRLASPGRPMATPTAIATHVGCDRPPVDASVAASGLVEMLGFLGDTSEHGRHGAGRDANAPDAFEPDAFDQDGFGRDGFDRDVIDRRLADWWVEDCWPRTLVWAAAAAGEVAAVDWMTHAVVRADVGDRRRIRGLLALDLRDVSRVAMYARGGTDTGLLATMPQSPVRVVQWLMAEGVPMASVSDRTDRLAGSAPVTRAWLDGRVVDDGDEFDALMQSAIVGSVAPVVELGHGVRRHVLVPIGSTGDDLDADHYCVDLLRRRGGWFGRHGRWTWDHRPADRVPPLVRGVVRGR